ncbi:hypothetical protein ARALYDRAFT_321431 [Arabidopsis lyrata subsp. lyrata]|uniref:Fe2OG dioxygenase domain-containing protein n=1 Tax=Arabidopsis lyrata subsp. lyrata TaxID=81972 RepID=D7LJQ7_ARALL|nr:hypothetical protein ARALYDRAFT_321431 [Arabidopsis lyrata subsp. lyrata]
MVLERDQDIPSSHIPVVDLSTNSGEFEEWGVFQVVNRGIPTKVIQRLQNWRRMPWRNQMIHPPSSVNYKYWPKNPLDYREANEEYTKHGLGLWGEAIKEVMGGEYMMIVNYYPPCPHSDLIEGLDPHTDVSGLTLILPNEIPGLQVFKDDDWFDLENIPSAVIVIIGDQIQRLSNGRTRMSWPVLVRPTNDMVVGPFPEIIGHDNPPKFKHIAYKDYIYRKVRHLSLADLDS